MGASRYLIGFVCAGMLVGCAPSSTEVDAQDLSVDIEEASGPNLPPPPPGATCVLIQRGTLGSVQDADIGYGNGPNWATGGMPYTWTGISPYDHWSAYQFDLSVVPPGSQVLSATFTVAAFWNMESSTVRAHRIKNAWNEATATWNNFGGNASWDPAVLGSFNPNGGGYFSVDVTGLTQGWVSGQVANHGLLLEEDPIKLHGYIASESSTASQHPSLYVCWGDPPPPVCQPVNGECSADADCCDGVPCNNGTCHIVQCGGAGAECSGDANCCAGNVCNSGVCGPPMQVCGGAGAACGAGLPACCNGICNDGTCPGAGGGGGGAGGGGGGQCLAVGDMCNGDADCCSASCMDGMCIATNQCVQQDSVDANENPIACNPANPCCDGLHCVFDLCFNDLQCVAAGSSCDAENDWCCWGLTCTNGSCQ